MNSRRLMITDLERLLFNSMDGSTNVVSSPLVSIFVSQSLRTGSISSCLPGVLVLLSLPPVLELWIMRRQDGNMLQARFLDFSTRPIKNVKLQIQLKCIIPLSLYVASFTFPLIRGLVLHITHGECTFVRPFRMSIGIDTSIHESV